MRIEAQDLSIAFGSKAVLENVTFTVGGDEMVGLIGPNGAGKTSLLHVLANLQTPRQGAVRYDGRLSREFSQREFSQRIAFLAQGGTIHWELRAEAVVALGRLPHRRPFQGLTSRDYEAIERVMRQANVAGLRHRPIGRMSGGERMRVLLARALAVEAELLLADEPTAALDPFHQIEIMTLMRETAHSGRGVIVVLHDLALAARFCDRLIMVADGRVVANGPPDDVLTDENIAAAYSVEVARGAKDGIPYLLPWNVSLNSRDHAGGVK